MFFSNGRTNERTDGRTDGRTVRLYYAPNLIWGHKKSMTATSSFGKVKQNTDFILYPFDFLDFPKFRALVFGYLQYQDSR